VPMAQMRQLHKYTCATNATLPLVGSLKLQVSIAKEPFKKTIFCKRDP